MSEHERKKKKAAVQSDRPEKEKEHLIKKNSSFRLRGKATCGRDSGGHADQSLTRLHSRNSGSEPKCSQFVRSKRLIEPIF